MQNFNFVTASLSVIGTRDSQQDSSLVYERNGKLLAVVCDGMGGVDGGEIASKTAVATLKSLYKKKRSSHNCADFFKMAAAEMDNAVYCQKDENGERLRCGTTIVAVIIERGKLTWLSVGDSRLYIIRGEEMIRVTRDHNYFLQLDALKAAGKLTDEQYIAESPRGESLLSYIGMGGLDLVDINDTPIHIMAGDKILLTSDGLYRAIDEAKIQSMLTEFGANGSVMALTSLAKKNSPDSLDNTTCVVIHCIGGDTE